MNILTSCLFLLVGFAPYISHLSDTNYLEVLDSSQLPLLNPDLAEREIGKLRLSNGLEILLISDKKAALSAAAVVVGAGSWNDPPQFAGMAHFCEHMLFMGTEKYPDENEFMSLVADHGGMTNAMTAPDRTVYMFSSNTDGFLPILDQFAHFFIDPLFKPANIAREMHAVDQEFSKSIEHDGWRTLMVLKETGNQSHPNAKFSCGNSSTLSAIPQSALIEWHRKHYSADKMRVVIYSSLSLETLKEKTSLLFSTVPNSPTPHLDLTLPLTTEKQQGHITYIQPIMEKRSVTLLWELPPHLANDPTRSAELVAYTLKRGQKKSLFEELKNEGLIENVSVNVEQMGTKENQFFEISLDLTEKGMKSPDTAILRVFQTIALLKKAGIPHYLFDEMNQIAKIKYQYQSRQDPFSFVMKIALSLPDEPLETYPRTQLLGTQYSDQNIFETIQYLTPEHCVFVFLANPDVALESQEKWMGAKYGIHPIPSNWLDLWVNASPNTEIKLPEPNPFIPTHLSLLSSKEENPYPVLIAEHELGTAYYGRCPEYSSPETAIFLHILSPELNATAKSQVLANLFALYLNDELHPILSAAKQAGLKAQIFPERSRLNLKIEGFSQKAPLLLETLLSGLQAKTTTKEHFDALYKTLETEYSNAQKQLAFRQAKELFDAIINPEKASGEEKLLALKEITYEDYLNFQRKIFETNYVEGFFGGNLTLKEAEKAWLDVIHLMGKTPYPQNRHPVTKVASLPAGPYSIGERTAVQGNATLLAIDEGTFSFEKRGAQELVSAVLKEAFFNELRTKQKTGYVAISDGQELAGELFQFFIVQSNSHQPEELLYRFELFIEEFVDDLPTFISKERFELIQQSTISSIKNRVTSLKEKSALWDLLAFQYKRDFEFVDKRIEAIENLTYDAFLSHVTQFLSRQNKKRVAILYEGKLHSPFAYEETTTKLLSEIALKD